MAGGLACALAAASAASACLAVTAGGASREALGLGVADELTGLLSPVLERAQRGGEQARARKECLEQMPVMIDVVVLGLSAGLSFDSSLELYCSSYGDALARGLAHALLSWRIGAATREEALRKLRAALCELVIDGVETNIGEQLALISDARFASGDYDLTLIGEG